MIKLKGILEGKVLSVFDFDDTIAKSDAWVYVMRGNRIVKKLDPAEFAVYKPRPGEEFDFREFDRKIRNPRLIKRNADLLVKQLDKARRASKGSRKVTILTARRLGQPVTSFLKTMGIDAYVVPLGSADPKKKADWIEKQINKGYDTVYFMDDSPKNISAVDSMLKRYPNVRSITKLIKEELLTEGKLGDCYQAGGKLIMDMFGDKEHKLVHGMVNGQGALEGMRYGHCWVESRNTILDHSNGRKLEIPKDLYYAIGRINPKECKYYTPEEAAKFMVDEGHWGPWEMSGDTIMAEEIPDRKSEIGKQDMKISPSELDDIESKLMMGEVDYHSKLSRGHKPDYYQLGTSEFKPFDKSRDDIEENITQNLIDAWKKETSSSELKMFCKRDGCGPAALDLKSFAKERGIELKRIEGFFHADKVASEKKDFTPEMKDEFLDQGGNFNNPKEREEWVENSKYSNQWKFIPHYWLEDDKGNIYDPVGQEQFIDMGYAKDLNKERYTLTDEVNENFADGKKPGRKGISKRVGIPKGATLTQLAKLAKAKGEKGRMARWQLNMRRGKKKKKS